MFYLVGGSVSYFAVPAILGGVVDAMLKSDWDEIGRLVLWMLIIVIASAFCVWGRAFTMHIVANRISYHLIYDLFFLLLNKDVAFFDENKTGELLSRMS